MIIFYAPDIEATRTLPESDSQHAVRVLRMTPGSELTVIDGRGSAYRCVLVDAHPKRAAVEITACERMPLSWTQQITIAVAPTKHIDRMEWMVEKLTEIGVNRIVPLLSKRSERKEIKVERLKKIAVSAMKQSLKAELPLIAEMTPVKQFLQQCNAAQRFIAHCDAESERHLLSQTYKPFSDVAIMIGPEGDFSPEEVAASFQSGWVPVTLGDNRLRTETAAINACDTFHIIDQISNK
ncbi:MAG: 16S rRNA (uracil(1498)-N(3))-methyltransferase [Firmicutes bacterium]|nr:16S rRNA (uracil(1498)-N(3))-methyltransferase [Bacillota bacterium]MCM1401210.1 16S rRNA (uracil(1498)-N(3))-methyltransferase [Bacteroides sp.]MCM1477093.1 16S rRNA (uracil(1498)-N(3))-methyltransferase [Bacteroides sp.]